MVQLVFFIAYGYYITYIGPISKIIQFYVFLPISEYTEKPLNPCMMGVVLTAIHQSAKSVFLFF